MWRGLTTLRSRLVGFAILLLLPGIAISAGLIFRTYGGEQENAKRDLRTSAHVIGLEVNRQFLQAELLLRTLAETGDLARGDLVAFDRLARSTEVLGGHLVLLRRDGREMINTSLAPNAELLDEPPPPFWESEIPGHAFVSSLVQRPDTSGLVAQIVLPLSPRGAHELDLILVLPSSALDNLLVQQNLTQGWSAAILDPHGIIAAHDSTESVDAEPSVLTTSSLRSQNPDLREGIFSGRDAITAYTRVPNSGWVVTTSSLRALIAANARHNLLLLMLSAISILGLGVIFAIRAATGISAPIEALARAARQLGENADLPPIPAGLAEADEVAHAMHLASNALRERSAAMAELNATLATRVAARTAELAQANQALQEQRAQLGLILDSMPLGVLVNQLDATVAYANPEARRLLRVGDAAFLPEHMPQMWRKGVELPHTLSPAALARAGIMVDREILRAKMHDGSTIDIQVSAGPIYDRNGKIALSVVAFSDVTAQLVAEDARRRAQRIEAIGQLTGGVAHEFNNLLMAITGCLDLLAPSVPAGRPASLLQSAGRAAERGARLTHQLLAFSRRQQLHLQSMDINALIESMLELLNSTLGRSVAITTDLDPHLSPALADPAQMELVLLNLSINARDAMPKGGFLRISTANVALGPPKRPDDPPRGEYVALSVGDNGTGMTPEVLARAFEPFFTTKDIGRGTGLGLPQVLGVAQQLGGGVSIESAEGAGTIVHIYLRPAQTEAQKVPFTQPARPQPRALDNVKILLVDDDDEVRSVAGDILIAMGAVVRQAANGSQAIDLLDLNPIDLVLADLTMPGMTGLELAEHIANRFPGLPVVLMTGYSAGIDDKIMPSSVKATLLKPFRSVLLVTTLTEALGPKKRSPP